eukprot:GFUD01128137.1.p1 GENE.GFUD01128137.1~~GFUD01128137.1.p1  ORF type:complete len:137 (+),score=32.97 GFUD01128137.1:54-413(+)
METTETAPVSTPVDTLSLATKVRHYLKSNGIQYEKFSYLVLGVSQPRLSTLLAKPKPWRLLSQRVQALYHRMKLWMDTRATYGNNPYSKKRQTAGQTRGTKRIIKSSSKRGEPGGSAFL